MGWGVGRWVGGGAGWGGAGCLSPGGKSRSKSEIRNFTSEGDFSNQKGEEGFLDIGSLSTLSTSEAGLE